MSDFVDELMFGMVLERIAKVPYIFICVREQFAEEVSKAVNEVLKATGKTTVIHFKGNHILAEDIAGVPQVINDQISKQPLYFRRVASEEIYKAGQPNGALFIDNLQFANSDVISALRNLATLKRVGTVTLAKTPICLAGDLEGIPQVPTEFTIEFSGDEDLLEWLKHHHGEKVSNLNFGMAFKKCQDMFFVRKEERHWESILAAFLASGKKIDNKKADIFIGAMVAADLLGYVGSRDWVIDKALGKASKNTFLNKFVDDYLNFGLRIEDILDEKFNKWFEMNAEGNGGENQKAEKPTVTNLRLNIDLEIAANEVEDKDLPKLLEILKEISKKGFDSEIRQAANILERRPKVSLENPQGLSLI